MKLITNFLNFLGNIFFRRFAFSRALKNLAKETGDELMDDFLETLLSALSMLMHIDKNFRRNIEGTDACYAFVCTGGDITASFTWKNGKMKVYKKNIGNANITIYFKDGRTLWDILMSGQVDIFQYILENRISYTGNPNYIFKFGYLANHLRSMVNI